MISGASLYAAAIEYVGVPFRHKGRSRAGLDCAGLVFVACRDCGIVLPGGMVLHAEGDEERGGSVRMTRLSAMRRLYEMRFHRRAEAATC